jgi:hypothetical protein
MFMAKLTMPSEVAMPHEVIMNVDHLPGEPRVPDARAAAPRLFLAVWDFCHARP